MAFLPTIPQATDALSTSQGDILNNFTILGAIAGNGNPSSASINTTAGFNWVSLPPQGATPPTGSAFPAANVGLYAATLTGQTELYINKTSTIGPVTTQIPMTASTLSNTPALGSLGDGWTYLPSGIIMQWGKFNGTGSNPYTITFPINFPHQVLSFTALSYSIPGGGLGGLYAIDSLTVANATIRTNAASVSTGQFIALGY